MGALDRRTIQRRPAALAPRPPPSMIVIADPLPLDAPRLGRRRQRPGEHDHPQGLRPPRQGLRPGLQRPAAAGRAGRRRRPRSGVRRASAQAAAATPGVVAVDAADGHPGPRRAAGGGDRRRLPDGLAAGRVDHRPAPPRCATMSSPRNRGSRPARPRRRPDGDLRGLQPASSRSKLPLFIGVVVLLCFLLLMAVFRSLVIPLMAAVMNLLSAGAAFGVITAVFQWRLGRRALRHRQDRADRGVRAGDDVRDPLRPLDGLRGLPRQPHLRGVAAARRQPPRRSPTAWRRPAARSPRPRRSWSSSSARSSSAASGSSSCSALGLASAVAARRADRPLGARPRA